LVVVIIAVSVLLAGTVPRVVDAVATDEIRSAVSGEAERSELTVSVPLQDAYGSEFELAPGTADAARTIATSIEQGLPAELDEVLAGPVTSFVSSALKAGRVGDVPAQLRFVYLEADDFAGVTWIDGGPPQASDVSTNEDEVILELSPVEIALSDAVAATLDAHVGSRFELAISQGGGVVAVVTGIFEPVEASDLAWDMAPTVLEPKRVSGSDARVEVGALLSEESLPFARFAVGTTSLSRSFTYQVVPESMTASNAPDVATAARSLASGRAAFELYGQRSTVTTQIDRQLDQVVAKTQSATAQALVVLTGVFAVAGVLLMLSMGIVIRRRESTLEHQRAVGGSMAAVVWAIAVESAALAMIGGAVGFGVSLALVPSGPDPLWIAPVMVLAALPGPVLAGGVYRRGNRASSASRHRAGCMVARSRRTVAEVAVALTAAIAVMTLSTRGAAASGGNAAADIAVLSAPVLVLAVGALALNRVLPLAWRWWRRSTRRTTGSFGVLTAATTRTDRLPVAAVFLGTALFALTLSLDATVRGADVESSWSATGADVVIRAPLAEGVEVDTASLAAQPGVTAAAGARIEPNVQLLGQGVDESVRVVAVDAVHMERLLGTSPLPDAASLGTLASTGQDGQSDALPLLSTGVPNSDEELTLRWPGGSVAVVLAGKAPDLPGEADAVPTVWVDRQALAERLPSSVQASDMWPSVVWVNGAGASAAVGDLPALESATVVTRAQWLEDHRQAPLAKAFRWLLPGAAALLALMSTLAVVVVAVAGAPLRATAAVRWRVLGLSRARAAWVGAASLAVPVVVASAAGVAAGVGLAAAVVGPLDLAALTGQPGTPRLSVPGWVWLIVPTLAAACLATGLLERGAAKRTKLGQAMRAG
jgi:putative ABC transport system permease protein